MRTINYHRNIQGNEGSNHGNAQRKIKKNDSHTTKRWRTFSIWRISSTDSIVSEREEKLAEFSDEAIQARNDSIESDDELAFFSVNEDTFPRVWGLYRGGLTFSRYFELLPFSGASEIYVTLIIFFIRFAVVDS